jgi:hypothetical protein
MSSLIKALHSLTLPLRIRLKDVKDPTLATENGDTVAGRIQQLMSAIENDVKECGKTIDTYRKQHLLGTHRRVDTVFIYLTPFSSSQIR